jgi:phage terminase Nu1 subunit (DNA packaging protein)
VNETVSTLELAKILDLSTMRIRQLVDEEVIPKPEAKNKHNLRRAANEYIRWIKGKFERNNDENLTYERTRLIRAQAEKEELELEEQKENLVQVDAILDIEQDIFATARSQLLALPKKIAPQISSNGQTARIEGLIENEIRNTLSELSTFSTRIRRVAEVHKSPTSDIQGVDSSPKVKTQRVGRREKKVKRRK